MVTSGAVRDDASVSRSPFSAAVAVPRVARSRDRVLTGVAGGYADRWGVEPAVVRAALAVTMLVGGLGGALYALGLVLSTAPGDGTVTVVRRDRRRELAIACATGAVLVAARAVGVWPGDAVMVAAAAAAAGIALTWTPASTTEARPALGAVVKRLAQVGAGVGLLIAGVWSLASRTGGLSNVGASLGAIAIVVGGLAMFAAPPLGRLLRTLDDERAARIREDERAAVAAHLHDSVLQSLVLIQRSDDPRTMATLARRQERDLRAWLYGGAQLGEPTTLSAAIAAATAAIEGDHDVRVEAVVVGDQPLDEHARTALAALREAVVNAARHAAVDRVDVFVEIDEAEITAFVRDTGRGFDVSRVPRDRRGIADSIVGRLDRAGGLATLSSAPGRGTEVEIRLPRSRR